MFSFFWGKVKKKLLGWFQILSRQVVCLDEIKITYPKKNHFNSSFRKMCVIQSCDKIPLLGAYGNGCSHFFGKKWKKILLAWFHILSRQVVSLGMLQSSRYEPEAHKVLLNCCLWQNQVKELLVRIIQKYCLICPN